MKKTSGWLWVVFFLPTVLLIGLVILRGKPHGGYWNGVTADVDTNHVVKSPLLDKWAAQKFTELNGETNLRQLVEQIKLISDKPLEPEKKEALTDETTAFILYFNTGKYDDFAKFRFVINKCSLSQSMSNYCNTQFRISKAEIGNSPQLALKEYWERQFETNFVNFWVGLSVENCQIQVESAASVETTPLQLQESLERMTKQLPNVGLLTIYGGSVRYTPSAKDIIAAHKTVDIATVRLLPKPGDNDVIYPVYLKLYWSPDDKKWLPYHLIGVYSGIPRKHDLWF